MPRRGGTAGFAGGAWGGWANAAQAIRPANSNRMAAIVRRRREGACGKTGRTGGRSALGQLEAELGLGTAELDLVDAVFRAFLGGMNARAVELLVPGFDLHG